MDEINVIVISSVRPEKSTAAAVTLHRHLVNRRGIQLHVLPAEHHEIVDGSFTLRLFHGSCERRRDDGQVISIT